LADLEFAAHVGQAPPPDFLSTSWTPDTLEGGRYTTASDIEQAGRLLLSRAELPPEALLLADILTAEDASKRPTAMQALEHSWFQGPDAQMP
jgi:hypothetical protein